MTQLVNNSFVANRKPSITTQRGRHDSKKREPLFKAPTFTIIFENQTMYSIRTSSIISRGQHSHASATIFL
jgi:hypothetical protein